MSTSKEITVTDKQEMVKRVVEMREMWKSRMQAVKEKIESMNKELNDLNLTRLALDGAIQGSDAILKEFEDTTQLPDSISE